MTNDVREPVDQGRCCSVLELRQYTLKPGHRDALIDLFDRHLVESQEVLGMTVVGQFCDRHRSDRFVWVRGFADMASRHRALEGFYDGPVWTEHKDAANETMLEWHDVRLLKPVRADLAFHVNTQHRPKHDERRAAPRRSSLRGFMRSNSPQITHWFLGSRSKSSRCSARAVCTSMASS